MLGRRLLSRAMLCLLVLPSALFVADPARAAIGDVAVIGDTLSLFSSDLAQATGYKVYSAGPVAGQPSASVDWASRTVTVVVDDPSISAQASLTLAWPARLGTWSLGLDGTEPEQHVELTRGAKHCTFTAGSLTVRRSELAADGSVAALSADVNGSCALDSKSGWYAGAAVRISDPDPASAVAIPRASPAKVTTGALAGTLVRQQMTVSNSGAKDWRISRVGTGSTTGWTPTFTVDAGTDTCTGVTLPPGGSCTVSVSATARTYSVAEHLVVNGDAPAILVVPLRLEGYQAVEPPTAATLRPGRLASTLTWSPPATLPRVGYRVYDVTSGGRRLLVSAAPSATAVLVPGSGPRTLALVAANGTYAESVDVTVDQPLVSSEIVANDGYGHSVSMVTDVAGLPPRETGVEMVDLDPSRSRWVTTAYSDVRVCAVDTEVCTPVPGTAGTSDADTPREAAWLPDGQVAFLRGYSSELRSLWVVRPDGSGLGRVASVPDRGQLAVTPSGTEVLLRNASTGVERVRLSDGHVTVVPGTMDSDDFSVSSRGVLAVERRNDLTNLDGPRTITLMNLDGTSPRVLALPAGDNRDVAFDPTGTRVAYSRHASTYEATVWVAAANGTGARQVSDAVGGWQDLKWSVTDQAAPTVSLSIPAYTTRTATIGVTAADADDPIGSLRRECKLDAATTWSPCGPTVTLSSLAAGKHTMSARVSDASGRQSAVSRSWTVDGTAPTTAVSAPASVQLGSTMTLAWTATDTGGSGVATSDVRARTASAYGGFGAYQYPSTWQRRTGRTLGLKLTAGYQYCFSVRSRDVAGNTGAWSTERCAMAPLDDRALSSGGGWSRGSSTAYLYGTYSRSVTPGAKLSRSSVKGRRIAVVATTCASCGSLYVYHAGVYLGRISLYSSTTHTRQVKWLPLQSVTRTGTVVLKTTSSRPVYVDGLAVFH